MAFVKLEPLLSHKVFRWASGANAAVSLLMLALGITVATGNHGLREIHGHTGLLFLLTSLLAALSALSYSRQSRNKGLVMHGFGVFVLAVAQYAIGEIGWFWVHIILGLAVVAGAVSLFTLALKPPPAVVTGTAAGAAVDPDAPVE